MAVGMVGMFGVEGPLTHIFRLLLIAYSDAAMHSLLTHAQSAYLCTARLPTCSLLEYFRETLPIPLQRNIMSLPTPPTDLDGWYEWAIKLQNNFLRMKSAISKTQNRGGNTTSE